MAEKKFEKKNLNRDDHKGMDDAAKKTQIGGGIAAGLCAVVWTGIKFLPKLLKKK